MADNLNLKKKILVTGLGVFLAGSFAIKKWVTRPGSESFQGTPRLVHELKNRGECRDCHSKQEHVRSLTAEQKSAAIPPPKSHTEEFRRFSHGRLPQYPPQSCNSCHEKQSCSECHSAPPSSHTSDFMLPKGSTEGSHRHAVYARMRPSSCLNCHENLMDTCSKCHSGAEVEIWRNKGSKELKRWQDAERSIE